MPVGIRKVNGYEVRTPHGVKAKRTTRRKAKAQARLLQAVKHGWRPTRRRTRLRTRRQRGLRLRPARSASA